MKITRLGPSVPILNSSTLGSSGGTLVGGIAGTIPTANGSNGWSWAENVARITSNGSNIVAGPYVNFAAGSNMTFAVTSNTLTIHGSAGGGGSSGGLVLLEQHTASSSATLDFTTFISATYDEYQIEFVNVLPATNDVGFRMRMGTGGGPTFDTGNNYGWDCFVMRAGGSAAGGAEGGVAFIQLNWDSSATFGVANTANWGGVTGHLRLFDPSSSIYKTIIGQTRNYDSEPFRLMNFISGSYESTTAVTAVQFYMSSGNIASGTIRAYGIAKS